MALPRSRSAARAQIANVKIGISDIRILKDCLPPSVLSQLCEEQLALQQLELSAEIAHSLKSQLAWALNRAWLDAKNSPSSLV